MVLYGIVWYDMVWCVQRKYGGDVVGVNDLTVLDILENAVLKQYVTKQDVQNWINNQHTQGELLTSFVESKVYFLVFQIY